jgi:apolipoprotein N-acyltransferase
VLALSRPVTLGRAFALGTVTGLVYFAGTLYWITQVMVTYGGLTTWVAVLVNAALVAYLALYPAAFSVIVRRAVSVAGARAIAVTPFVWVATELGRTRLFTGFPWVLLGYSQAAVLPVAQLASLFGVYGVSALVAGVSAALAFAAAAPAPGMPPAAGRAAAGGLGANVARRSMDGVARYFWLALMFLVVVAVSVWGSLRVADGRLTREGEPIRVGLVQGNVDQAIKWNADRASSIFQEYLGMTRQAIAEGAEFVLWPESSTPFFFEEDRAQAEQVERLARQARVPILVGSDQIERGTPARFFNSAFLVRGDGTVGGVYRKMHLVPFGEYVPLKRVFFFAAPLVEAVSDFSPGDRRVLLNVGGHLVSAAICYEIIYPEPVRQFVRDGSELLTTITNDAWFGSSSAPYQHFEQAAMRAIEDGRYLVRSANTGVSGIVDPYGHVVEKSAVFKPAVLVGEARFLRGATVYARIGDVFAYASLALTIALLAGLRRRVK